MNTTKTAFADKSELSIGLFDSGIGGLTVLRAFWQILPNENYLFLGDTARLPYGTKSNETITKYALQASAALIKRDIKLLVIACNTATAVALPALRAAYPNIPVVGVVEPGARAACKQSKTGKIAVIATESATRGRAYEKAIHEINKKAEVLSIACPLFVPLAEDGLTEGYLVEGIAERYLGKFFRDEKEICPDCLVLGCTHFPLLANAIQNVVGDKVQLVDSAYTTALTVQEILKEMSLENKSTTSSSHDTYYMTTDDVARFAKVGKQFLGVDIDTQHIELVDL